MCFAHARQFACQVCHGRPENLWGGLRVVVEKEDEFEDINDCDANNWQHVHESCEEALTSLACNSCLWLKTNYCTNYKTRPNACTYPGLSRNQHQKIQHGGRPFFRHPPDS